MTDPSFIHLCQPDAGKSCAACCGLYNYRNSSREALTARLRNRTRLFRERVRDERDLLPFSHEIRKTEPQARIYPVIHCCEYSGFLDEKETRVGCLLHPLMNQGRDLRDVSFYGRELCDGHFCPSYHFISREEKQAILHIIDDWYLYGLCITDIDLVKEYFRIVSDAVGEMPNPGIFRRDPFRRIALDFFSLKLTWPFRSHETNRFGKYYFDGSQYMIHHLPYEGMGCDPSPYDRILVSLTSHIAGLDQLREAEQVIGGKIDAFVKAYTDRPNSVIDDLQDNGLYEP